MTMRWYSLLQPNTLFDYIFCIIKNVCYFQMQLTYHHEKNSVPVNFTRLYT